MCTSAGNSENDLAPFFDIRGGDVECPTEGPVDDLARELTDSELVALLSLLICRDFRSLSMISRVATNDNSCDCPLNEGPTAVYLQGRVYREGNSMAEGRI